MNPNDEIRDAILRHLYSVHAKAQSPSSAAIKIRELHKAMKVLGYKSTVVGGNLAYLIDTGFVDKVVEERTYRTQGGTMQSSPVTTYKVSAKAVDRMERASLFAQQPTGQQINVTTINGVTVVGDKNVVSTRYTDLSEHLEELRTLVLSSSEISERDKLDAAADIDTIRSQLQKPEPDGGLIRRAWQAVERVATAGGAADAVQKIAPLIDLLG
jgi:hypothetical protein